MFKKIAISSIIIVVDLITIAIPLGSMFLVVLILNKNVRDWFFNFIEELGKEE